MEYYHEISQRCRTMCERGVDVIVAMRRMIEGEALSPCEARAARKRWGFRHDQCGPMNVIIEELEDLCIEKDWFCRWMPANCRQDGPRAVVGIVIPCSKEQYGFDGSRPMPDYDRAQAFLYGEDVSDLFEDVCRISGDDDS